MNAFITGSHAYGTPAAHSDLDLVILLDPGTEDADKLWDLKDPWFSSCRYRKLNLVTFTDPVKFNTWKEITEELIARKPVSRDEAIKAFQDAGFSAENYQN